MSIIQVDVQTGIVTIIEDDGSITVVTDPNLPDTSNTVSYTHLTLPTNREV